MAWQRVSNLSGLLKKLKSDAWQLVALEQSERSVDYKKAALKQKTALILGNEVRGLSAQILRRCDRVVEIPLRGRKESLNVAVACGIILFRLLDI